MESLPDHPGFLWRNPEPRSSYDVVIVGGGGHGRENGPEGLDAYLQTKSVYLPTD